MWSSRRVSQPHDTLAFGGQHGVLSMASGRGAVWLARYHGVVEVPGSSPGAPTILMRP